MSKTPGSKPPPTLPGATEHDRWFRARVREALEDSRPDIPHEEVEAQFARKRVLALLRPGRRDA